MRALVLTVSLLVPALLAPAAATAQDACAGVSCAGHGECMLEDGEPFCLCDDGYAAEALACTRAAPIPPDLGAMRSTSIGARIVQIASHEGGRSAGMVGHEREGEAIGPLREVIKPGELWCSDFVSWVYRVAGVPFTGGYQGGWHLTNNYAMRRWFERQGRWVSHEAGAWDGFQPRPGDYLRFHTSRHGHSAIVRYVAGETLYTVEGNSRGLVRLRRYWHYKQNRRIDGFGIVTNPEARAAWLRRQPVISEGAAPPARAERAAPRARPR